MNLRKRMIPPGAINGELRRRVRLHLYLFWRDLWHVCDDFGRFEANAALLRAVLFSPVLDRVSERDVQAYLQQLHEGRGIKLYTVKGQGYGKVLGYEQPGLKSLKADYPDDASSEPELFAASDPPPLDPEPPAEPDPAPERKKAERKNPTRASAREEGEPLYFSDRLFITLLELCGIDRTILTEPGRRKHRAALRAILAVKPDLHPAELEQAAAAWKSKFSTATPTPNGFATHWALLMGAKAITRPAPIVEEEALGWRDWINEHTPDAPYARGGEKEGEPWHDLPAHYRRYLLEKVTNRPAA